MEITFYAVAENSRGQIGQMLTVRKAGQTIRDEFTGVIYKGMRAAERDITRLNRLESDKVMARMGQ